MRRSLPVLATTSAAALLAAPAAGFAQAPPAVEVTPGPEVAAPSFSVRYTGSSHQKTTYRATPSNPGGPADLNTARDEGRTKWVLTYPAGIAIPAACGGEVDPCSGVAGPTVADGKTSATGRIDHKHVDGLYDQLDAAEKCTVRSKGVPRRNLPAIIDVDYDPAGGAFRVTANNPVYQALVLTPQGCNDKYPDGIDRIQSNYFAPGFSFDVSHGPDTWFRSESVAIPFATWRTSTRIRLRLGPTKAGTPPKNCAKRFKYERCTSTGKWSGVLTLTRRPA